MFHFDIIFQAILRVRFLINSIFKMLITTSTSSNGSFSIESVKNNIDSLSAAQIQEVRRTKYSAISTHVYILEDLIINAF